MDLTAKQKAFIEEYLTDFNATRAAERAGYGGDDNTLAAIGSENLRKPKIAEAIGKRLAEKAMTVDEILARYADQARGDIADFINTDVPGGILDLCKAEGKTHLIKRISWTKQGVSIELYDAQTALNALGKAAGIFRDRVDNLNIDMANLTEEQLERIAGGEDPLYVLASSSDSGT